MPFVLLIAAIVVWIWFGRRSALGGSAGAESGPLAIVDLGKPGHPLASSLSDIDMLRDPISEIDPQGLGREIGKDRCKR